MNGSPSASVDPRYVAARRALLDALEALLPHHDAVVVIGAQAIYLRTGDTVRGVAPFTTDGDLALHPTLLDDEPQLEVVMTAAGFRLQKPRDERPAPGVWEEVVDIGRDSLTVQVDLIVPQGAATGGGRRGARLGPHGKRAARKTIGVEAALVDHGPLTVAALDPADHRSFEVEVAGLPALLIAKAHKIHDRVTSERRDRADDKDAADAYRIMQSASVSDVARCFAQLRRDPLTRETTDAAVGYLTELFGRRGGPGIAMAARALRLAIPEEQITAVAPAYVGRLTRELDASG